MTYQKLAGLFQNSTRRVASKLKWNFKIRLKRKQALVFPARFLQAESRLLHTIWWSKSSCSRRRI